MSDATGFGAQTSGSIYLHHSDRVADEMAANSGAGISIKCVRCSGQIFRRSRLRPGDLKYLVLLRYPVRCLRCSRRQPASFTVAGISEASHLRHRQTRPKSQAHWATPSKR